METIILHAEILEVLHPNEDSVGVIGEIFEL